MAVSKKVKIIDYNPRTVGDLIDALQKIPRHTALTPCGDPTTTLAYDAEEKIAYLDEYDWIDENILIDEDEDEDDE